MLSGRFASIHLRADGTLALAVEGGIPDTAVLEMSTDFATWLPATEAALTPGRTGFEVRIQPGAPQMFYRIRFR